MLRTLTYRLALFIRFFHHDTHHCLCASFRQKKHYNDAADTVLPKPCRLWLQHVTKTEEADERKTLYATVEVIKTVLKEELNIITKNDLFKCFEDWKKSWHKCIISGGNYFLKKKLSHFCACQKNCCFRLFFHNISVYIFSYKIFASKIFEQVNKLVFKWVVQYIKTK